MISVVYKEANDTRRSSIVVALNNAATASTRKLVDVHGTAET